MRSRHRTASTFKVPHALIALQTGVITPATVLKWNGTAYDFESWRRDHTLDSAMKASVLPFFQNTARLIGEARMRKSLAEIRYAADTFDGDVTTFWIDGDLVVSPMEQFDFLQRLFSARLPIDAAHVAAVKSAMRMPAGQILLGLGARPFVLDWPKSTIVRAKTGNTTVKGERVSWLIGALEHEGLQHSSWQESARPARSRTPPAPSSRAAPSTLGESSASRVPRPASRSQHRAPRTEHRVKR